MISKHFIGCVLLLVSMAANADSTISTQGEKKLFTADGTVTVSVLDSKNEEYSVNVPYLIGNNPDGKNIVLIHGFAHDSDAMRRLADSLILNEGANIARVYSLDLPGHGLSQWPKNTLLGSVSLNEYVIALETFLKTLPGGSDLDNSQANNTMLVGHSMGGIIIELLADKLKSESLSLGARGVGSVMLFAPTLPEEVRWLGVFNPKLYTQLLAALTFGPQNGCLAQMSNGDPTAHNDFTTAFFTDKTTKELYAGTGEMPTTEEVHYINNAEPCLAGFEVFGLDSDLKRPSVNKGVLADTKTLVAGFTGDMYIFPIDVKNLYNYLIGSTTALSCNNSLSDTEVTGKACALLPGPHDGIWTMPTEEETTLSAYLHWSLNF